MILFVAICVFTAYATSLVALLTIVACRGKPVDDNSTDFIEWTSMILMSPIFIIIEGSKWCYHNHALILQNAIRVFRWLVKIQEAFWVRVISLIQSVWYYAVTLPVRYIRLVANEIVTYLMMYINQVALYIQQELSRFGVYLLSHIERFVNYIRSNIKVWLEQAFLQLLRFFRWVQPSFIRFVKNTYDFIVWTLSYVELAVVEFSLFASRIFTISKALWSKIYSHIVYPAYYYFIYVPCYVWFYEGLYTKAYDLFFRLWDTILRIYNSGVLYSKLCILYERVLIMWDIMYQHSLLMYQRISLIAEERYAMMYDKFFVKSKTE